MIKPAETVSIEEQEEIKKQLDKLALRLTYRQ